MTRTLVALLLASLMLTGCFAGRDRGYDHRDYGDRDRGDAYHSEHHDQHGQDGNWGH